MSYICYNYKHAILSMSLGLEGHILYVHLDFAVSHTPLYILNYTYML